VTRLKRVESCELTSPRTFSSIDRAPRRRAEHEVCTNAGSLPAAMRAIANRFGELEKQHAAI